MENLTELRFELCVDEVDDGVESLNITFIIIKKIQRKC